MIKFKTTRKQIKSNFATVISLGYGHAPGHLFGRYDAFAYTSGAYGWNADCYTFDCWPSAVFVAGYRPFGISSADIYAKASAYDKLAEKTRKKYCSADHDRYCKVIDYLLTRFVKAVKQIVR